MATYEIRYSGGSRFSYTGTLSATKRKATEKAPSGESIKIFYNRVLIACRRRYVNPETGKSGWYRWEILWLKRDYFLAYNFFKMLRWPVVGTTGIDSIEFRPEMPFSGLVFFFRYIFSWNIEKRFYALFCPKKGHNPLPYRVKSQGQGLFCEKFWYYGMVFSFYINILWIFFE